MGFLFLSRKKILKTRLLQDMIDIHTHILPGVDDGIKKTEDSIKALNFFKEKGIKQLYLTPHIMAEYPNTAESLLAAFSKLKEVCPPGIELRLAAEYMLDSGFSVKPENDFLLFARKHLLVETSFFAPPLNFYNILYDLIASGYTPVLAHPERYQYMNNAEYKQLKDKNIKFQLNLYSLNGFYGARVKQNAIYLLTNGFYDFIGSDFHNLRDYEKNLSQLNYTVSQGKELDRLIKNNYNLWYE